MIARILILVIIFTILPYLWIDRQYCRFWARARAARIYHGKLSKKSLAAIVARRRLLLWLPAMVVIAYSAYLTLLPNFLPENPVLEDIWFVVMAFGAVPQFVFAFFSFVGGQCRRLMHGIKNWGNLLGMAMAIIAFFSFIYGFTIGFRKMEVKRLNLYVPNLPKAFDGYRIVQFSDIHVGSYYGWRSSLPKRDVDSIMAQHADLICFTGDLQNVQPAEIEKYKRLLSTLHAKDGVVSVLGNHDYTYYMDVDDPKEIARIEQQVQQDERDMGWRLLNNEHITLRRGGDSIFVAGTENYDKPKRTHVAKALYGIKPGQFVLMLQHIPTQWEETWPSRINKMHGSRDTVLVSPQLTLSGHTHAGQISLLGLRPTLFAPFDYGLYEREGCQLYTTSGLGGTVPIRIGATAEIVVITLRCR